MRSGAAPQLIAAHEEVLSATPRNLASRLSLAYLYESTGQSDKAKEIWATFP